MSRTSELELETLQLEQDGRVLTVLVNDPPYNFMTARMQKDLDQVTRAVDSDDSVGAVVLTGGVEGRYVTHFDIADILAAAEKAGRAFSQDTIMRFMRGVDVLGAVPGGEAAIERTPLSGILNISRFNQVVQRIMRSPAVWIAAIGGPCGGGGLEMSVCFDVRLASDHESVGFILPELLIGLVTTVGGQRLAQLIGPARALEMLLEGRVYSPQEAVDLGLVSRVVPAADLLVEAQTLAARYATRNRSTIAAQKQIFNEDYFRSPSDSLRREGAANAAGVLAGPAPQALRAWVQMQDAGDGDSVFLTDLEPWRRGEVVDLNG